MCAHSAQIYRRTHTYRRREALLEHAVFSSCLVHTTRLSSNLHMSTPRLVRIHAKQHAHERARACTRTLNTQVHTLMHKYSWNRSWQITQVQATRSWRVPSPRPYEEEHYPPQASCPVQCHPLPSRPRRPYPKCRRRLLSRSVRRGTNHRRSATA